jgi:hypothetical protein
LFTKNRARELKSAQLRQKRVATRASSNKGLFVSHDSTAQTVLFPDLGAKSVVVRLEEEHSSSDGGGVLHKGVDQSLGLTEVPSGCLRDPVPRQADRRNKRVSRSEKLQF